eukprot:TRINITY_DN8307_c0_g1_i2.p2 TRINITY_DN8307_c0_g1~~TRINITY_DN8307_c0_g1_i2.p2  ORF type:complete len:125 (-),score=23.47 TRINITY_DN8307_c0_g1_i2:27-401(-)
MADQSIYIRVKNAKRTIFLRCQGSDNLATVRGQISKIISHPPEHMRLFLGDHLLEDNKSIAEQRVENDTVVALSTRENEEGEWSDPAVESPDGDMAASEAAAPTPSVGEGGESGAVSVADENDK